ncbi:MAG: glycoside hydrolase family 2 [Clostridia bacterium]|nr:glycoside hydrolase family 2 [Clostridia bacterium]
MRPLSTRWGRALDAGRVKPEYPRPNLVRDSYLNLNGPWAFCVSGAPECRTFDRTILVPFPPEAPLSGVGRVTQPDEYLHYQRSFQLPEGFDRGRVLLHFGAVDQECEVFVNDVSVGSHRGGYNPFTLEITQALRPGGNALRLRVRDRTERAPYARGKQKLARYGKYASIFYTPCSGIWKTVWLESVPERYITGLRFTPLCGASQVRLEVCCSAPGTARVCISFEGREVWHGDVEAGIPACADLPDFRYWSPERPDLYDVTVEFGEDRVTSYFGMRCFERKPDRNGVPRFYLNGEPFFFNGLLDQGYWPESLLTAPSDAALEYDIRTLKAMGFNTLRMHVKVEEERFYHLCDRIGMVVWQDMPNGGGEYNMFFVTELPNAYDWFARGVEDSRYDWFMREDTDGREQFLRELDEMVSLLYNYPCIALWTPFNEGWGQFDAQKATRRILDIDRTRLINEACGWFDQGGGDLHSIHNYTYKLKTSPKPPRAVALTEYGGYSWAVEGHTPCEKAFGYQAYGSREELTRNYRRLWEEEIYPNLESGLSAAIYTQVSDIEEEINGFMTYDREVVKLDASVVCELNRRLYEAFAALSRS